MDEHRFTSLPAHACHERLQAASVGRVAWSGRRGPQILPVTYVVHEGAVVFRTDVHGPLAVLQGGEPVVFEVDELDSRTRCGWSVVVRGRAYSTSRSERAARLWRDADPVPWAAGSRPLFVTITVDEITGRRVERDPVGAEDGRPVGV